MVPIALVAVWYGAMLFDALVAGAAATMAWEWGRLTLGTTRQRFDLYPAILAFLTVAVAGAAGYAAGVALFLAGALLLAMVSGAAAGAARIWAIGGFAWIILPCVGLVWIRNDPVAGGITVVWIMVTVWAIDTSAYVVGKSVGGPRLAPWISPSKTWAGLAGGVAAAGVVGLIAGFSVGGRHPLGVMLIGVALALVEQSGDLAESFAKRRFGVKDSSGLIPGHGGLLDRLDGMLAVIVAVVLLDCGLGESVLQWH